MSAEPLTLTDRLSDAGAATHGLITDALQNTDGAVAEAMVYATSGGKAMRAFLVLEGASLYGIKQRDALPAAAAVECIHAYSLVHDDMPIMDDDDLRRGRATVHKKWDDATALLVGDALQSLAFQLIGKGDISPDRKLNLSTGLARASGIHGMVRGQERDIAAETANAPLPLDAIIGLQAQKTGALIEWSATAGPVLAGADPVQMRAYGRALGLAFQIADDILDVTGDEAKTGKRMQKDADAGKATFVSHLGLDNAKDRARALVAEAVDALTLFDIGADSLRDAARFAISREF